MPILGERFYQMSNAIFCYDLKPVSYTHLDAKKAFEVEEKTCLIIGLGTIGKIIAHLCLGLDMKVIGYDTFLTAEQMSAMGVEKYEDKFEALKAADVVIVQMPLIEGVTNNTIAVSYTHLDVYKRQQLGQGHGSTGQAPHDIRRSWRGFLRRRGLSFLW